MPTGAGNLGAAGGPDSCKGVGWAGERDDAVQTHFPLCGGRRWELGRSGWGGHLPWEGSTTKCCAGHPVQREDIKAQVIMVRGGRRGGEWKAWRGAEEALLWPPCWERGVAL